MDTKTAISLALGLGREDTAALDEWARAWGEDITPDLVSELLENFSTHYDCVGNALFREVAMNAAYKVAEEAGIDLYNLDSPDRVAYFDALNIEANASASRVYFWGEFVTNKDELAEVVGRWKDARVEAAGFELGKRAAE